jgi:hypothetical protein
MAKIKCPYCEEMTELKRICDNCGARLDDLMAASPQPAPKASAPSVHEEKVPASGPAAIPAGKVKCPFCGEIVERTQRCGACGAELLVKIYAPCAGSLVDHRSIWPEGAYVLKDANLVWVYKENEKKAEYPKNLIAGRIHYLRDEYSNVSEGDIIVEIDDTAEPPLESVYTPRAGHFEVVKLNFAEGALVTPEDTIAVVRKKNYTLLDPFARKIQIKPTTSGHVYYFRKQGERNGAIFRLLIAEIRKD